MGTLLTTSCEKNPGHVPTLDLRTGTCTVSFRPKKLGIILHFYVCTVQQCWASPCWETSKLCQECDDVRVHDYSATLMTTLPLNLS